MTLGLIEWHDLEPFEVAPNIITRSFNIGSGDDLVSAFDTNSQAESSDQDDRTYSLKSEHAPEYGRHANVEF